jgi:hypothetical protein
VEPTFLELTQSLIEQLRASQVQLEDMLKRSMTKEEAKMCDQDISRIRFSVRTGSTGVMRSAYQSILSTYQRQKLNYIPECKEAFLKCGIEIKSLEDYVIHKHHDEWNKYKKSGILFL